MFIVIFLVTVVSGILLLSTAFAFTFSRVFPALAAYRWKLLMLITLVAVLIENIFFRHSLFSVPYYTIYIGIGTLFLSLFILIPASLIVRIRHRALPPWGQIATFIGVIFINIFGLYNGLVITVREYTVTTHKATPLIGKTLALASDTHYGRIFTATDAERLARALNATDADIVLIPGDLFDGPLMDYEAVAAALDTIEKPVFYAVGNHEEYRNTEAMLAALQKTDFHILINRAEMWQDVHIAGVNYHENRSAESLRHTLESIGAPSNDAFSILLRHEPTHINTAHQAGYDLVVSGHTHKGQMWPFSLVTRYIYGKYFYGINESDGKYAVTTSGVG